MKKPSPRRARDERGVSLIEVMIGLVILASALLGLIGASGLALHNTVRSSQSMQMWAAVQWKADSLVSSGYGNVTNGSDTVQGYPMSWIVSGTDPERIDLLVDYPNLRTGAAMRDTLIIYLFESW